MQDHVETLITMTSPRYWLSLDEIEPCCIAFYISYILISHFLLQKSTLASLLRLHRKVVIVLCSGVHLPVWYKQLWYRYGKPTLFIIILFVQYHVQISLRLHRKLVIDTLSVEFWRTEHQGLAPILVQKERTNELYLRINTQCG